MKCDKNFSAGLGHKQSARRLDLRILRIWRQIAFDGKRLC